MPLKVGEVEEVRRGFLLPGLPEGAKTTNVSGVRGKQRPSFRFRAAGSGQPWKSHLTPGCHTSGGKCIFFFRDPWICVRDHEEPAHPSSQCCQHRRKQSSNSAGSSHLPRRGKCELFVPPVCRLGWESVTRRCIISWTTTRTSQMGYVGCVRQPFSP